MYALIAALAVTMHQDTTDRWAPLAQAVEAAIAGRAFPGAVVAVGRRDTVLYLRAFGRTAYERGRPVTTRTVYDVASLTKVVGLTTAVMMLHEEGRLDLEAPVRSYVPLFGAAHDSTVTIRHLLMHSSGLPAWRPYFQTARTRDDVMDAAAREPLEYPTGTRMIYSDVGAINLTRAVERLTGERLDRYLARRLFGPLGMRDTRFMPPRSWRTRIAPTERDTTWRRRLVHGEVHDENTSAMAGVSGHAGLFSTAEDLARFARMMLRGGRTERQRHRRTGAQTHGRPDDTGRVVREETIAEFTRRQQPELSHRALGWETPNGENSAGTRLSPRAFGHTGFTGVSLWIDPAQDLFVILLTNRVHPTRENTQIFQVRRQVADLAVLAAAAP